MDYNYHTHTFRCHHATGKEEEYVIRAIDNGIKYMGYADHIPLRFPDGFESNYRVPYSEACLYTNEIKRLKEKYKDKVEISIGFESEYFPELFDKMLQDAISWGAEYLILGQHFFIPEHPSNKANHVYWIGNDQTLEGYSNSIVKAIQTGKFSYVCHPDLVCPSGNVENYKKAAEKICLASKEYNIPVELNFLGIRENRTYPNPIFWEIAGKIKSPVTFGFDAHAVLDAFDKNSLILAKEMVKTYNLNYIGKPKLLPLK